MLQYTFDHVACAGDSTALEIGRTRTTVGRGSDVIDEFRARHRTIHGGGIAKISDHQFDMRIAQQLGIRLPAHEQPHPLAVSEQASDQVSADESSSAGDEDLRRQHCGESGKMRSFAPVGFPGNALGPFDDWPGPFRRHQRRCSGGETGVELGHELLQAVIAQSLLP